MSQRNAMAVMVAVAILAGGLSAADSGGINIVPLPEKVTRGTGSFTISAGTVILTDEASKPVAQYLSDLLSPAIGGKLTVLVETAARDFRADGIISIMAKKDRADLGPEGYEMKVGEVLIEIVSAAPAGAFYACQTLRQLLPVEIESARKVEGVAWTVPAVEILDRPRYPWRGSLLDVGRHFFDKAFIKKYIDLLALHKMNRFHWHLTEDQGWRIEIKKYPQLTAIGSSRKAGPTGPAHGGFYTQEDVREIVAYAASRHVMVVPEIEMPGHSLAALACYPQLSCTGGPFEVGTRWGVIPDVYCGGNDEVFGFLENVLTEVIDLFPAPYIHIGGDECPKDRWKKCPKCQARIKELKLKDEHHLQSYFIQRMEKFLNSKNRRIIGWDEILEGGLAPNATVQSWRGMGGGVAACQQNHDVIMSPTSHCYLDYSYHSISIQKAYNFEPTPSQLTPEQAKHVLGLEGNAWTEHMDTSRDVERMVFPRASALAEAAWTPRDRRDYGDFRTRLNALRLRLAKLDVQYGSDPLEDAEHVGQWLPKQLKAKNAPVELEYDLTKAITKPGTYEVIFWYGKGASGLDIAWAALLENGSLELARDTHKGFSGARKTQNTYHFIVKEVKPGAKYTLKTSVNGAGNADSRGDILIRRLPDESAK